MYQMLLAELDLDKNAVYEQERCCTPRRPFAHRHSLQTFGTAHLEGSYLHEHGYSVMDYVCSHHDFAQALRMYFQLLENIH